MLKKKKVQSGQLNQCQTAIETPSLPRLQQINALEREVIAILGRSNIIVDPDRDLFSRLEELYLSHLQRHPLGLQMLQRIVRLIGEVDAPAKVRMLYLIGRETYLADGDPVKALQEGFKCNLNLKQKLLRGFQCGLLLAEMSKNPSYVQVTLNTLIVSLENEIGFHPTVVKYHKANNNDCKTTPDSIKKVYIGGALNQRHTSKSIYEFGKLKRLDFSKCLYEAYLIGFRRLQSQAKRRYYGDCLNELKRRLIRQNPGIRLEQRLNLIDEGQTLLKLFYHSIIHEEKRAEKIQVNQERIERRSQSAQNQYKQKRNFRDTKGKIQPEASKNIAQSSISDQFYASNLSNMTSPSVIKSLKIQLKQIDHSSSSFNSGSTLSYRDRTPSRKLRRQLKKINLVDVGGKENKGSLVLKFDRLINEGQSHFQIKKKKLKTPIVWEQKKNQKRMVVNVVNVNCLPQIKEEVHKDFASQTEKQEEPVEKQKKQSPQPDHHVESLQSICEKTSAERIDYILKEGLNWSSCLDTEKIMQEKDNGILQNNKMKEKRIIGISRPSQQLNSNFEFKNANSMDLELEESPIILLKPRKSKQQSQLLEYQHDSFSQTRKLLVTNEKLSTNTLKSTETNKIQYKIVIKNLEVEKMQTKNQIVSEQIDSFLRRILLQIQEKISRQIRQKFEKVQQKTQAKFDNLNAQIEKQKQKQMKRNSSTFSELVKEYQKQAQQITKKQELDHKSGDLNVVDLDPNDEKEYINNQQQNQKYSILKDTIEFIEAITGEVNALTEEVVKKVFSQEITKKENQLKQEEQKKSKQKLRNYYILKEEIDFYIYNLMNQIENFSISQEKEKNKQLKEEFQTNQQKYNIKCPEIQHNSDSQYDDSDLSSEIHSEKCNSIEQPINQIIQQKKIVEQKQRKSQNINFSRFALQKLSVSKKSDEISNSQDINQNQLNNLRNSLLKGKNNSPETLVKKIKSRSNSNGSVEADIETIMKENTKRNSSQLDVQLPFSTNIKQQILCFDHWLKPQVRIINNKIQLKISHPDQLGKYAKRYQLIPEILMQNVGLMKKVEIQVKDYLQKIGLKKVRWQDIVFQLDDLRLLPDEIEVLTVNLNDKVENSEFSLHFYFRNKSRDILGKCFSKNLKIPILDIKQNGTSCQLLSKLTPQNIIIRGQEVYFNKIWTMIGKRNIKLRDKYQNIMNQCLFQVLEWFNGDDNLISFLIKTQTNESMKLEEITLNEKTKIINNIDTIIGFALKIQNKKIILNDRHLKDLIKIL